MKLKVKVYQSEQEIEIPTKQVVEMSHEERQKYLAELIKRQVMTKLNFEFQEEW